MSQLSLHFIQLLGTLTTNSSARQLDAVNAMFSGEQQVDTLIFFGTSRAIEPLLVALTGTPKVVISDSTQDFSFAIVDFNRNIGFLAVGGLRFRSRLQHLSKAFAGLQGQVRGIFVAAKTRGVLSLLHEHFEWCWRKGFSYAIVILVSSQRFAGDAVEVYGYTRFPRLQVEQLQVGAGQRNFFADKFTDLHGYRLRTPVQYDPPRVFEYYDRSRDRVRLGGYAAQMFQAFLKNQNGRLEVVQVRPNSSEYNIPELVEQLQTGGAIDVSMNPYVPYARVRTSYPIRMMQWCLLLPFSGEIARYEYFLRPFHSSTWLACIGGLFALSCLRTLSDWLQSGGRGSLEFGRAFLALLRLMLNLPVPGRRFRAHYAFGLLLAVLLGFVLSNLYLASLTSLLAKVIFKRQVDTTAEMVAHDIKIHVLGFEIPIIMRNRGLAPGFANLLVSREALDLLQDLVHLKTGQAYAAREDTFNFVLFQQSHLLRPVFHLAGECITTVPVGFLMPPHSQFESVLNRFVLRSEAAGLTDKWIRDTPTEGLRAGILRMRKKDLQPTRPLGLQYFQFAWFVLLAGHMLAACSFVAENFARVAGRCPRIYLIYRRRAMTAEGQNESDG